MAATVNVQDLETHISKLVERAHAGEEIILAKAGQPYAKLVPIAGADKPKRKPGRLKGRLADIDDSVWFDPLPDDELDAWEGKYSNIV